MLVVFPKTLHLIIVLVTSKSPYTEPQAAPKIFHCPWAPSGANSYRVPTIISSQSVVPCVFLGAEARMDIRDIDLLGEST